MIENIKKHIAEAQAFDTQNAAELEAFRIKFLGSKGLLKDFFTEFKNVPNDQKKEFGQVINLLKTTAEDKVKTIQELLESKIEIKGIYGDLTRPEEPITIGSRHPISLVKNQIIDIFSTIGFNVSEGPEIEDDWHNFTALNLPEYHPARDMQDTFFIQTNPDVLLRTHTSPVQIRTMMNTKPPIRMIAPGSVFRRDYDLTHTPMFHQVEGLVVEEEGKVSFANLKFILEDFLKTMFGDIDVRFRPSFFPFTEPSAEVDISCIFCAGKGCRVCSKTGWLEVLGCGIVDPNVFKAVGYENVSGYAFGLGVERFAMLIHRIGDLRSLFEGDVRLLEQFR